jgi:putative hydrolase of the HAD superfamily
MDVEMARSNSKVPLLPISVRGIIFDAVGTILRPAPPFPVIYQAAARRMGVELEQSVIYQKFVVSFGASDEYDRTVLGYRDSEQRERDRWHAIVSSVFAEFVSGPKLDALFEELFAHYGQPASWQLFADTAECWRTLRQRGYRVGIGSNYDSRLQTVVAGQPPLNENDGLFISSLVGYRKPAREFYEAIAADWQLRPEELLMIGDDRLNDYQGALDAGWHALFLDRDSKQPELRGLRSLQELCAMPTP